MDVVAEHQCVAMYPDGVPVLIVLRVGRPFAHPKGDYACSVEAKGLRIWQGPSDISGASTLHALMLGLRFLRAMLIEEADRGVVFRWEDSEQTVTVNELFVLHAE